ncbi:hypothetical protein BDV11DRAFT_196025 [Aspergillus similis]
MLFLTVARVLDKSLWRTFVSGLAFSVADPGSSPEPSTEFAGVAGGISGPGHGQKCGYQETEPSSGIHTTTDEGNRFQVFFGESTSEGLFAAAVSSESLTFFQGIHPVDRLGSTSAPDYGYSSGLVNWKAP